jgi:hypothetical protein
MTKEISEDCTAIVFYGVNHTTKAVAFFYDVVIEWYNKLGHPPNKAAIRGPGHSGKFVSFQRADNKLRTTGLDGVTDVELYSLMENAKILGNDYLLKAMYSESHSLMYFISRSSILPLSRSVALPIARRVAECGSAAYGIGYTRQHRLGPSSYAVGIAEGLGEGVYREGRPEREEALRISSWIDGMANFVWRRGFLRDIYPWNFVNRLQLGRLIGDISLERWIQQDARRGRLEPLNEGLFLWEIAGTDIPSVRDLLQKADIIFRRRAARSGQST